MDSGTKKEVQFPASGKQKFKCSELWNKWFKIQDFFPGSVSHQAEVNAKEKVKLPEEHRQLVQTALEAANSLRVLTTDLLDISKMQIDQLHIRLQPFSLAESIEHVRALFSRVVNDKGLKLQLEIPASLPKIVVGDAIRIQQVLSNLQLT